MPQRSGSNYLLQITRLQILMNGVVVIDKPPGLTSHDVVNRVRRILGQRAVGHLGTLDPSATGVLPIVLGNLTRLAQFYAHSEKTYEGVIRFGFATDTYDADGEPTTPLYHVHLTLDDVGAVAAQFRGVIEQMPPPFSAKKIAGVPAYKLARKKQQVELKPVAVEIKEFEILDTTADHATFRARVASGTYIRSVAHEMGQKLGCGAHLASLRRTAAAEFTIEDGGARSRDAAGNCRVVVCPSPKAGSAVAQRHRQRRKRRPNPQWPRRQSTGNVARSTGKGLLRSKRSDRNCNQNRRDAFPSEHRIFR